MEKFEREKYWNEIYETKQANEVSWYQQRPETSLAFIKQAGLGKDARILDMGGGNSQLVDCLLAEGYKNITVVDVSSRALDKARERLRERAGEVKWIVADAATFVPTDRYDFWHDRAVFHFLTTQNEIDAYVETVRKYLRPGGKLLIATFSEKGPQKCSGLKIQQYSEVAMDRLLDSGFAKVECRHIDHLTPSGSVQNFIFCFYNRKN